MVINAYFQEGKTISEEVYKQYNSMVRRIAGEYSRKFRMLDRDDMAQEMWMWFLTHPGKTRTWMAMPLQDGDKLFARSLRNHVMGYCVKEKAKVEGYAVSDNFWYTKDFIKQLLPSVISEDWKRVQASFEGGVGGTKPANESGDWMAYAVDVRRAYDALPVDDRILVELFYVNDSHGVALQEAAEKPSVRAAEMAANRAVAKMVRYLGGERPYLKPEPDHKDRPTKEEETE
jgi:DNA-directed RNA polymerase specialized sigma24 family protein